MRKTQVNNSKESSMTITSIAHFTQLQHYIHFYHLEKILCPKGKGTTLSINITPKTVRLSILDNQNEHLQREVKNTLELQELLIPEDTKMLIIAGNTTMASTEKTRKGNGL